MGTGELLGQPDRMPGSNLRWTCILSSWSGNTPSRFMLQNLELSTRNYEPVWLKRLYLLFTAKNEGTFYYEPLRSQEKTPTDYDLSSRVSVPAPGISKMFSRSWRRNLSLLEYVKALLNGQNSRKPLFKK